MFPGDAVQNAVMNKTYDHLLVAVDGPIATVTLNRVERRNALSLAVMRELTQVLQALARTDVRGVILAANGPVFSAGHDFSDLAGASLAQARELFGVCTTMMNTIQSMPQPVVARVHALATAGGCQLVASCDLAVAASTATFAIPGGKAGLFCHTPVVAVPPEELESATRDLIDRATRGSALSKALGKQAFYRQIDLPQNLAYDFAVERMATASLLPDSQEGIAAFLEKRPARFTQRPDPEDDVL